MERIGFKRGNRQADNSFKRFCLCREMGCGIKDRRKGEMENTKVCFYANGKKAVETEKLTRYSNEHIINYGTAGGKGLQSTVEGAGPLQPR